MTPYEYELIRSSRSSISIRIQGDGKLVVHAPLKASRQDIERMIARHADWIARRQAALRQQQPTLPPFTREQLQALALAAQQDLPRRAALYAPRIGVTYNRITIRAQKTRWGSCSSLGNLNFNCLLMLCPEEVRDYLVVHELCHLLEMNHSPRFWREVERVMPDYALRRKWLKEHGGALIRRLN